MKKLETLQNHIVQSGLVNDAQISLHIANLKPYYEPEETDNALVMNYNVALFIKDYTGKLHLLALILELAIQEIWQNQCSNASIESIETDPLDSQGFTVAAIIKCQEGYDIKPVNTANNSNGENDTSATDSGSEADASSESQDTNVNQEQNIININGQDVSVSQGPLIIGSELPYLKSVSNTKTTL